MRAIAKDRLRDLKVGDRVWVDETGEKTTTYRALRTVLRLTPKQVVVDWPYGDKVKRFNRAKPASYPHLDPDVTYYEIGSVGWHRLEIQNIATASECEQWDADQETAKQKALAEMAERKRKEELRDELRQLFGKRMVGVSEAHHQPKAQWNVGLYLTEDGVRRVAQLIDQLTPEQLPSWKE